MDCKCSWLGFVFQVKGQSLQEGRHPVKVMNQKASGNKGMIMFDSVNAFQLSLTF